MQLVFAPVKEFDGRWRTDETGGRLKVSVCRVAPFYFPPLADAVADVPLVTDGAAFWKPTSILSKSCKFAAWWILFLAERSIIWSNVHTMTGTLFLIAMVTRSGCAHC